MIRGSRTTSGSPCAGGVFMLAYVSLRREPVGEGPDPRVPPDAGEGGGGHGERLTEGACGPAGAVPAVLGEDDLVLVLDLDLAAADDAGADLDDVVVGDGAAVADLDFGDDEEDAGGLELGVADAGVAEELGAGHLEPGEIGGVVGDAHGVALAVADADLEGAL